MHTFLGACLTRETRSTESAGVLPVAVRTPKERSPPPANTLVQTSRFMRNISQYINFAASFSDAKAHKLYNVYGMYST